jgi:DMSO/TMAO reductase YedYZ molybdopterin-dependent catalytic subunit
MALACRLAAEGVASFAVAVESETQSAAEDFSPVELALATRNHGLPLEALRYDLTPVGLHYLLIHFDIPLVDPTTWRLEVGGEVGRPLSLSLDELKGRPRASVACTLECAGNGRARLSPRPLSQPWLEEAVGNSEWTGTQLAPLLEEAGVEDGAVEVLFTGLDRGVQGEVEHAYARSLPLDEALRPEMLLAYEVNGRPLPPQHGFPLRLIVPGWYGMTHVKWLDRITVLSEPFEGYQQAMQYRTKQSEDEAGEPVTRMLPRSLLIPPGIPDFPDRQRFLEPGSHLLEGRAWSGWAPIERVEVSIDGGRTWHDAELDEPTGDFGWRRWTFHWDDVEPGEHELCSRASDGAGNVQPVEPEWNYGGYVNNAVQRVPVIVRS